MFVIFVTALAVLLFRPNVFLFIISILSFYGAFSGVRSLRRKRPERGERAARLDWGAASLALLAGVSFIVWGTLPLLGLAVGETPVAFSVLGIVFGVVLGKDALDDLKSFRRPNPDPLWWWTYHLERMVGSYLAAVTAFMVQNVAPLLPEALEWTVWVAPGVLGGVGISFWIRHYRKKFASRRSLAGRRGVMQAAEITLTQPQTSADLDAAAGVLAASFQNAPNFVAAFPDAQARVRALPPHLPDARPRCGSARRRCGGAAR